MASLEMTKAKTEKEVVEEEAAGLRKELQVQQRLLEEAKQAAAESRSKLLEEQAASDNSSSQMQVSRLCLSPNSGVEFADTPLLAASRPASPW